MLATSSSSSCHNTFHAFLPAIPSPLSPRSANINGRYQDYHASSDRFMASDGNDKARVKAGSDDTKPIPFAKRPVKKAPSPKQDELQARRKRNFLRRVQEKRDDKRFEGRSDDIMRLDFFQNRRAWEAQQAAAASNLAIDFDFDVPDDDEAYDLPSSTMDTVTMSQMDNGDEEELVDDVLQRENEELEALIADMPSDGVEQVDDHMSEHFGSDDDEYDALFSRLMETEQTKDTGEQHEQSEAEQKTSEGAREDDAMDTS